MKKEYVILIDKNKNILDIVDKNIDKMLLVEKKQAIIIEDELIFKVIAFLYKKQEIKIYNIKEYYKDMIKDIKKIIDRDDLNQKINNILENKGVRQ